VVVEIRPGLQVGVDGDRVGDAQLVAPGLDVRGLLLEGVLGGVDADDLEPVGVVRLVKPFDPGNGALTVDARVRPEVDQGRSTALGGRLAVRVLHGRAFGEVHLDDDLRPQRRREEVLPASAQKCDGCSEDERRHAEHETAM